MLGLKKGAHHHATHSSREDIADGIMHAAELLEKKRPRFENMALAYVWLLRAVGHYLQHCHRAAAHVEDMDAVSHFAREDAAIQAFVTQDALDHALERLNEEDLELIYLNHVSGLTLEEIATMRGVSLDSIKARHSRAMKRIRK